MKHSFLISFFIGVAFFSCKRYPQINIKQCKVLDDTSLIKSIKERFINANDDTLWRLSFAIDYKGNGYRLIDKENKWNNKFSEDYFDIIIKYVDENYLVLYCPRSGIASVYKLFGTKSHDIYLINRKDGVIKMSFKAEEGVVNSIVRNNTIYFEFYEPYQIKYYPL